MHQELLIALFAGLGGMLGWGFADFFAKKTIDEIGSVASLVWAHVFGVLALLSVVLYSSFALHRQIAIPNDFRTWGLLIFFGSLQAVIYLLVYQGFSKGQLAVLNPVFASYSGLAAIISIIVFGEVVSGHVLLGLATIFAGVLLLNIDPQALRAKRMHFIGAPGLKEVGLAALLAAFWTVSWDKFIGGQDWLSYALFMYASMALAALVIAKFQKANLFVVKSGLWKFLILIGVCEVIAYMAISLGFSSTSYLSMVAILSSSFSLPTIILARVFLKEKVTRIQTIGSIAIIAGIVLLSLL